MMAETRLGLPLYTPVRVKLTADIGKALAALTQAAVGQLAGQLQF